MVASVQARDQRDLAQQWAGEETGSVLQRQWIHSPTEGERGLQRLRVSTSLWRRWGQRKGRRERGGREVMVSANTYCVPGTALNSVPFILQTSL